MCVSRRVIVFSTLLFPLKWLGKRLAEWGMGVGRVTGEVSSAEERIDLLSRFKSADDPMNVIMLSNVGDAALDMPDANVIIQISSQGGGRRQEAQRLGRILRPKSTRVEKDKQARPVLLLLCTRITTCLLL